MDFYSSYAHGFARVAACTIPVSIADPAANARTILEQARACHDDGVALAVFPELSLCGYSIDDLFLQDTLLEAVEQAIVTIVRSWFVTHSWQHSTATPNRSTPEDNMFIRTGEAIVKR